MNFQAGLVYFDEREIPASEIAAMRGCVQSADSGPPATHFDAGALVACTTGRVPEANQPAADRTLVSTFDGRLDNREDLLLRLGSLLQRDRSDPAVAEAAFRKWGTEGLANLVGDWSLVVWDARRKTVVLASDFAGVRPLYYCVEGSRVLWSTRLGPLADVSQAFEIDDEYVAGLLACKGSANRTPYRGIFSVPPGHAVTVSPQGTTVSPFWRIPIADTLCYQRESEYEEHLRFLFREAVRTRLQNEGACLCELSGGMDSSSVVSMAEELVRTGGVRTKRLVTFTVEHEESRDKPFYAAVERHVRLDSVHVSASSYPFLTETHTGGASPAFWERLSNHTAERARQMGATTCLTGRIGDETMGNWHDDSDQVAGLLRGGRIAPAFRQALAWSEVLRVPLSWILGRAFLSIIPAPLAPANGIELRRMPDKGDTFEDSISPAFRKRTRILERQEPASRDWTHARPERRRRLRTLMQILESRRLQVPEPLEEFDYTHPFAHRPLLTFMLSIPPDIVCRPGEPRRLMRRALQPLWPDAVLKRRSKDGFGGVFLKSLRPLARSLRDRNQPWRVVERGYVDRASLEGRLERLLLSLNCNVHQLKQIILLEFWLRNRERAFRSELLSLPA